MAREEKMTVIRFLKRNTLYIVLTTSLILLAAALITVLVLMFRNPDVQPEPPQEQESVQTPQEEEKVPEETPPEPEQTPDDEQPEVFQPPFMGRTKFLANQKFALTYDDEVLQLVEKDDLYTLLPRSGETVPRMDLQQLYGTLAELSDEELQWLAVSILQKYYYLAPDAGDIVLSEESRTQTGYCATLDAPAYKDAAAAHARVQFLQIYDQLWYVAMLIPEGCDGAAVEQAFDNLVIR